jgi:transposase
LRAGRINSNTPLLQWANKSDMRKTNGRLKTTEAEAKRAQAYELFMNTSTTLGEIGKIVGVQLRTVSEWATRYQWREAKAANSITREKNVNMMLLQINNLLEDINKRDNKWPTAPEADTITKITKNIRSLSGRTALPDYYNVQTEFLKFLHHLRPALAKEVADVSREFLQTKARELDA